MTAFTLFDELLADPVQPLPPADVANRVGIAEHALLALCSGSGTDWGYWNICALVVGFMDAFIDQGSAADPDGLLLDAHAAITACRRRAEAAQVKPTLTGPETGVLLALIEDYAECLRGTSARSAVKAMRATEKRSKKFLRLGP